MWNDVLAYIHEKVPKQVYETWFTPVVLDRIEDTTAYLAVPNKFFGDWLDEHYRDLLAEAVSVAQTVLVLIPPDGVSWLHDRSAACN